MYTSDSYFLVQNWKLTCLLTGVIYSPPPKKKRINKIMLIIKLRIDSLFWAHSPITFKHVSFGRSLLKSTPNHIPLKYKSPHYCYVGYSNNVNPPMLAFLTTLPCWPFTFFDPSWSRAPCIWQWCKEALVNSNTTAASCTSNQTQSIGWRRTTATVTSPRSSYCGVVFSDRGDSWA